MTEQLKASEVVVRLQKAIKLHGDLPVALEGCDCDGPCDGPCRGVSVDIGAGDIYLERHATVESTASWPRIEP